jgi:hypothetical protein
MDFDKYHNLSKRQINYYYCQLIQLLLLTLYYEQNMYWVIQNDFGQVWQLCTKMYVATV